MSKFFNKMQKISGLKIRVLDPFSFYNYGFKDSKAAIFFRNNIDF